MTSIGGPSGIGGPKGPSPGPEASDRVDGLDGTEDLAATTATTQTMVDGLATEIAAGRLTANEAIDQLVELTAGTELGAAERAELRELLSDLVANDPYLAGLAGRV